jgi:hypothetical protein
MPRTLLPKLAGKLIPEARCRAAELQPGGLRPTYYATGTSATSPRTSPRPIGASDEALACPLGREPRLASARVLGPLAPLSVGSASVVLQRRAVHGAFLLARDESAVRLDSV